MGAPRTKQWESLVEFVDALRTCLGLETYENIRNRKAAVLGGEVMKRRARAKRGRIAAGPLATSSVDRLRGALGKKNDPDKTPVDSPFASRKMTAPGGVRVFNPCRSCGRGTLFETCPECTAAPS